MNHIDFMTHIFSGTRGYIDLTAIHPQTGACRTRCYAIGRDRIDWDRVMATNDAGWGMFYGVTTKHTRREGWQRGTEATAHMLPAIWCEIDLHDGHYADLDAIQQAIYDVPQPATVITHSGGGIHALWRICPIEIDADNLPVIKEVLRGLAVYLHGDTKACDVARVLRLPGTVNTKPQRDNARCEVVDALLGELRFEDFLDYRQYAQPVARPIERELPALPAGDDEWMGAVIWYERNGNMPKERNSRFNWAAHAMYTAGASETDALTYLLPIWLSFGKGEQEGRSTIHSAFTGKRGTPSTVDARTAARMRAGDAVNRKSP